VLHDGQSRSFARKMDTHGGFPQYPCS
jgi:hypothetical protein